MGEHFKDGELEAFLVKSLEINPDTIEMYRKVFTEYAFDVRDELKTITGQMFVITPHLSFFQALAGKVGTVEANSILFEDLREYISRVYEIDTSRRKA